MWEYETLARDMRNQVFWHMLKTRPAKYITSLISLESSRALGFILAKPKDYRTTIRRGKLLESYYVLMRIVDDVADGDLSLPAYSKDIVDFVNARIDFASSYHSENPRKHNNDIDNLMFYCFKLAEECGFSIEQENDDILRSLLFDSKRLVHTRTTGRNRIFPEVELRHHFYLLDIRGTIKGSLKIVVGEDSEKYPLLEPLGEATRIYYNLKDLREDLRTGLINISVEDCKKHGIPIPLLEAHHDLESMLAYNSLTKSIKRWEFEQAERGLSLIRDHQMIMRKNDFKLFTRIALKTGYEIPVERYFRRVLRKEKKMRQPGIEPGC